MAKNCWSGPTYVVVWWSWHFVWSLKNCPLPVCGLEGLWDCVRVQGNWLYCADEMPRVTVTNQHQESLCPISTQSHCDQSAFRVTVTNQHSESLWPISTQSHWFQSALRVTATNQHSESLWPISTMNKGRSHLKQATVIRQVKGQIKEENITMIG